MRRSVRSILYFGQILLLYASWYLFFPFRIFGFRKYNRVLGVCEIAGNLAQHSALFPGAFSICLEPDYFYNFSYNFALSKKWGRRFLKIVGCFVGPVALGILAHRSDRFFYIYERGFLTLARDGRWFEFSFLSKRNKEIYCIFVGSDVRSPKLERELYNSLGLDCPANYYSLFARWQDSEAFEEERRRLAVAADRFCKEIFNARVDQSSYLTRPTHFPPYMYPDESFFRNDEKFVNPKIIKVIHSPSNPIAKATPLVRSAIYRLKSEGYQFEYTELKGVLNDVVIQHLRESHIALNQFYALAPGLFAIEAMAANCALMTSSDPSLETSLPEGADQAWLLTRHYHIYENLKKLLDNPDLIQRYANRGYDWALKNASFSSARTSLSKILGLKA